MGLVEPLKDTGTLAPILGGVAALLSTLVTVAFSWFKDRSVSAQRVSKLDEASKRISLLESWFNARSRIAPDEIGVARPMALEELDSAFREVKDLHERALVSPATVSAQQRAKVGWFRRLLLLYAPPRKRGVARVLFYLVMVEGIAYPLLEPKDPEMGYFFLGVGVMLVILWMASVMTE